MSRTSPLCTLFAPAILALAALSSTACAAENPPTLAIGEKAPDFELPGVDGKSYRLGDFSDAKVLVLIFTCNHCPTAQMYEERMKQLVSDYKDKGVAVVAISSNDPLAVRLDELGFTELNDSFDEMKIRAEAQQFNFPYLYDGDKQEVARAYGPAATPHVFIFDQDRKLRFAGRIDDSPRPERVKVHDTRNAIDALLAGKSVPVEITKVFGCSIKWSDKRSTVTESLERWAGEEVGLAKIELEAVKDLVANPSDRLRVINVWSTTCVPCVKEFPELVSMHRMYRKRPFQMVTISADPVEKEAAVLKFLEKQQASTTNYLFAGEDPYALAEAIDPEWNGALPYTLVVAPGGKVLYRKAGEMDPMAVKQAIVGHLGRFHN
ncbi:MAG: redoxin domain-containing protein [Planctomycetota bacterium]